MDCGDEFQLLTLEDTLRSFTESIMSAKLQQRKSQSCAKFVVNLSLTKVHLLEGVETIEGSEVLHLQVI